MSNSYTGEENHAQTVVQRCLTRVSTGAHEQLVYLSAFNIFLSIFAVLGNTLILVALRKESSLHPPSKLLFRCLALTDLCVGLITQPLAITYWMSVVNEHWNLCHYAKLTYFIAAYALCSVSLLTVTAISVDRLLALLLGLRYRQVVTLKRTCVIVVSFWIVSIITSASYLINHLITIWYGIIVIPLCIITSIFSYCKIFLSLRHHQTHVQDHVQQEQPSQINPLNKARYKKAVSGALWVQCTLVSCYLPYGIVSSVNNTSFTWEFITATLIYFNSSLNPCLYCWKISEVKQAVKQTIREALCCLSN